MASGATISVTIEWGGYPVKVANGKVFLPAFGTTINNHSMHWSWCAVPVEKLRPDLREYLQQRNYIS